ncbi:MAG: SRPBCC family protein [Aphanocapsa sp. GSE-SYN-MK-11-07L]|nr:SRPBCC family protein [Aphanocapsa sp. GSE-SYN-MK-11-07L]
MSRLRFLNWMGFPLRNCPLAVRYQVISSASVDLIWQKVINLADVSWHPLIASTNVPYGLVAKPGLIYQAVSRLLIPLRMRIFVERVRPEELLSVRILALPGLEEQVTYQIESSVCGTCISYSVMLRGWLSPLIWSLIRGHAAQVANQLAISAEAEGQRRLRGCLPWQTDASKGKSCFDF